MTSLLESTTKPIATNTQPPGYQPHVTAGGEQFRTFVHPELYRETPILEIENFSLWYGSTRALYHITLPIPRQSHGADRSPMENQLCCVR